MQRIIQRNRLFRMCRSGFLVSIACCLSISVHANDQMLPRTGIPPIKVMISAENIQLLNTFQETAITLGYTVAKVEAGTRSSSHDLFLIDADPEKALTRLVGRTNHIVEYTRDESPQMSRVVLLDIGVGHGGLPPIQNKSTYYPDALDREIDSINIDEHERKPDQEDHTFDIQSLNPENAIPRLENLLGSKLPVMREWAINKLGEFGVSGHQRAVLALGQVLFSDPLPSMRVTAVNWLLTIGNESSIHFVNAARNDKSTHVRIAASGG